MARIRRIYDDHGAGQPQRIWKLGKYIRLSRDDGSSESISNQRKILDEQIGSFFHNDYEVVSEYIDDNRTGTSDDTRPEFLRIIADVKSGKINCIITKNLSRAFRNSANQGRFLEEFIPLYNTRFISLYEPHMDTFLNPEIVHSLEVSITGFMNEQYAYKTSVDVRRTLDTKRRKGEFIGAFAPYGYKKNPENKNILIVDGKAAENVREIFHLFVEEGMSKRGIAGRLNELGIPNPAAYKRQNGSKYCNPHMWNNDGLWGEKTIHDILISEMYIGNMVQGRQKVISYKVHDRINTNEADWYIVENTHEAIVDQAMFAKARMLHQRDTRTAPGQKTVYLFSGFLCCADCGKSMTRRTARNRIYYACSTYTRKSKNQCSKHSVREDILIEEVLSAVQKQIVLMPSLREVIEAAENEQPVQKELKQIVQLLEMNKAELEKILYAADGVYMDWKKGEIAEDEYRRIKLKLDQQSERLKEVVENLLKEKEKQRRNMEEDTGRPHHMAFTENNNIDHIDRKLLVLLINKIYVHENGELTIVYNFTDQKG